MKANQSSELPLEAVPFPQAGNAFVDIPVDHEAPATEMAKHWHATVYHDYSILEMVWRRLEKTGHCTVFQGYDYVAALYDAASSAGAAEPLIVVVSKEKGGIAWILPLCISQQGKLRVISFADLGLADYIAPLIASDAPSDRDSVRAMLKVAFAVLPPCDIISFQKLADDIQGIRNPLLFLKGLVRFHEKSHGIRITEPWPDLANKIVQRTLYKTIKREKKRLEKAGTIKVEYCSTPETIEPALETLIMMRRERFKAMGLVMPPVWENFYRILVARQDRKICASIAMLTFNGQPIAGCFGLMRDKTYYALLSTFKIGEWESYRPGIQLFDAMLTKFSQQTGYDGYFDFTIGDEVYKGRLGADTRILYSWTTIRSLKGLPYYMAWWIKSGFQRYPRIFDMLKRARNHLQAVAKKAQAESASAEEQK